MFVKDGLIVMVIQKYETVKSEKKAMMNKMILLKVVDHAKNLKNLRFLFKDVGSKRVWV